MKSPDFQPSPYERHAIAAQRTAEEASRISRAGLGNMPDYFVIQAQQMAATNYRDARKALGIE